LKINQAAEKFGYAAQEFVEIQDRCKFARDLIQHQ